MDSSAYRLSLYLVACPGAWKRLFLYLDDVHVLGRGPQCRLYLYLVLDSTAWGEDVPVPDGGLQCLDEAISVPGGVLQCQGGCLCTC